MSRFYTKILHAFIILAFTGYFSAQSYAHRPRTTTTPDSWSVTDPDSVTDTWNHAKKPWGTSESTITKKTKDGHTRPRKAPARPVKRPSLYIAWDENTRHLCAMAKFQASFVIKYETASGAAQLIDKMPTDAKSSGWCDKFDEMHQLDIMWKDSKLAGAKKPSSTGGFNFGISFKKFPEEGNYGVQQMQLLYNTGHPVFRGAVNPREFKVKSNKEDYRLQFHTNIGTSMLCPSPPPIQMYDVNGTLRVIARLSNLQLQAFEFSEHNSSNFDQFMRCGQVSFGSGVAHSLGTIRNDSLTFGIGIMTVFIASLTVVGYAFYRSHVTKSEEYKVIE